MAQLDGPPGYGGFRPETMRQLSASIGQGIPGGPARTMQGDPGIGMPLYDPGMHTRPSHFQDSYPGAANPNRSSQSPMRRTSHSPNMRMMQPQFDNSYVRGPRGHPVPVQDPAGINLSREIMRERQRQDDIERSLSGGRPPMRLMSQNGRSPELIPLPAERFSPFKQHPVDIPPPIVRKGYDHPINLAYRVDELLKEIETLKRERDSFEHECQLERAKNQELEEEFHVLRKLIQDNTRPIGFEENLLLKTQFHNEREMRITCEQDVNRLRQQLADALASSHRDTLNLKKALSDMQQTNAQALQTIYEKGDQNLQQMQQLEDLSKIIREKDKEIEGLNDDIEDLKGQCRDLHNEIRVVKQEAAQVAGERGNALLMNSSMKDKMLDDPRFRKIVDQQDQREMAAAMKKNP